jgi:cytochrome c-type biogenesis protein CcmE
MNKRKIIKVVISSIVIGLATVYLLYETIKASRAYYYGVDEFAESEFFRAAQSGNVEDNRVIRLGGRVKLNSLVLNAEKMQITFELAGQNNSIPVKYYGVSPTKFAPGKEIIVEGKAGPDGVFQAKTILTRCESKYKVKLQTDP